MYGRICLIVDFESMEDLKIIFARNLIMLRKQMKLTQIELAEKINLT